MLWDAGQQRVLREGRERLAELYVGVRDGYVAANVALKRATAKGDITPSYARAPEPEVQRSPAIRDAALARLGEMYPGMVVRGVS